MNDRTVLFSHWAPATSAWSPWVKPVPFAFWPRPPKANPTQLRDTMTAASFPAASSQLALVIDLPGPESVRAAPLLASRGFRPVPIFASCPATDPGHHAFPTAVDVDDLLTALAQTAPAVAAAPLPETATPAFLVDAQRMAPGCTLLHDYFDNRSALFAADFPSARTLRQHGIDRVLVVRGQRQSPDQDLIQCLLPWREAGIGISAIDDTGQDIAIAWPRFPRLVRFVQRLRLLTSLHPNVAGGYGTFIEKPSGG